MIDYSWDHLYADDLVFIVESVLELVRKTLQGKGPAQLVVKVQGAQYSLGT